MCASEWHWSLVAFLSVIGCQGPMTDFVPRRPSDRPLPETTEALVEIVPHGTPTCAHQTIGSAFAVGRTNQLGHCERALRTRAASAGGDGVFDIATTRFGTASICMARVYVCEGNRS